MITTQMTWLTFDLFTQDDNLSYICAALNDTVVTQKFSDVCFIILILKPYRYLFMQTNTD